MPIRFELMFTNGTIILQVPPEAISVTGNDGFPCKHSLPDGSAFTLGIECMIDGDSGERVSTGMSEEILRHLTSARQPRT